MKKIGLSPALRRRQECVRTGSERHWRLAMTAAAVVFVAFSAVLIFHLGDDLSLQWFSNISLCAMPFVAAMACFWRAWGETGRARTPWIFIGASALSWSCGQMIWTYYESFRGNEVPFPSYADLGYLLAVPLLVAGLLLLASGPRLAAGAARTVLDGMVVATSLLLVSWEVVLETVIDAGGDTMFAKAISLSYPVGDIICASVAIVVIARTRVLRGLPMGTLLLLTAGTVLWAFADSGFAYFGQQETYYSGHPIDIGWFGGYLLLALAALSPRRVDSSTELMEAEHSAPVWVFAPYLPVVLAVVAASFREWTQNKLGVFMAWGILALIILVVAHQ